MVVPVFHDSELVATLSRKLRDLEQQVKAQTDELLSKVGPPAVGVGPGSGLRGGGAQAGEASEFTATVGQGGWVLEPSLPLTFPVQGPGMAWG